MRVLLRSHAATRYFAVCFTFSATLIVMSILSICDRFSKLAGRSSLCNQASLKLLYLGHANIKWSSDSTSTELQKQTLSSSGIMGCKNRADSILRGSIHNLSLLMVFLSMLNNFSLAAEDWLINSLPPNFSEQHCHLEFLISNMYSQSTKHK